ncbi:MAG: polyprenyl synthetase family protein [Eubacteriales bacterium]|nr:polyprenyl synthetase family protein [Eubacteriales bacterium]
MRENLANQSEWLFYKTRVETYLAQKLPLTGQKYDPVLEAMRYSLLAGGKRVRASLVLLMGEALAQNEAPILEMAAALEMIHAYSLIHDDLPAMDNDDWRRGRPSCHVAYGEALAILAGDGLLNSAMEVLFNLSRYGQNAVKAAGFIAKMAGVYGMIGGQTLDLCLTGKKQSEIPEKELLQMIDLKCAALFRAALAGPAIMAGLESGLCRKIEELASVWGSYFQFQDDLLDAEASRDSLGKTVGKDQRDHKLTSLSFYGQERLKEILEAEEQRMAQLLDELTQDGLKLDKIRAYFNYLSQRTF